MTRIMNDLSPKALTIYETINKESYKLGDIKKLAREIKKDHDLALELWSTQKLLPRQLAVLILDKKLLTQDLINQMDSDMQIHPADERNLLMEWLMANQLMKDKNTIALMETWQNSPSPLQRRTFWYYQARLRWTGQNPPANTPDLLSSIETKISKEEPEVQWAMNFTAAWIGIYDEEHRNRCITLGEKTGLYKDEVVAKGCTPRYLPEFIRVEVGKRE